MTITYWSVGSPEVSYECTLKNIKTIDFYNGYIRCYTDKHEEIELQIRDLLEIEED